ncbi:MAG: peptidoglycan bridge formation glycyltransferase FemA/FemB family protein [Patescibacteria group bacterium]
MISFLQSDEWAQFQRSLGRKVFDVEGTKVIRHDLTFKKNYLYVPYPDTVPNLLPLAEQEKSIFIKAEPMHDEVAQALVHQGYQKSSKNVQPHRTVVLDLTNSEDALLSAMHHKTRYNIRVAEREHVVVEQSTDTNIFLSLMKKTTARDKFHTHSEWYYHRLMASRGLDTKLWIAWHDGKPIASAITLTYGDTAYYLHGASDYEYRSLMGPYLLHWKILLNFKHLNFKLYDFWGIDAKKWPGVTRFKLGWGGRTIEYPGAFDFAISKPWYFAYTLYHGL